MKNHHKISKQVVFKTVAKLGFSQPERVTNSLGQRVWQTESPTGETVQVESLHDLLSLNNKPVS